MGYAMAIIIYIGLAAACPTVSLSPPSTKNDLRRSEPIFPGTCPQTLLVGELHYCLSNSPIWVGRYIVGTRFPTTHNREKEMYEDIDAPSVYSHSIIIPAQVRRCRISSGVTLGGRYGPI